MIDGKDNGRDKYWVNHLIFIANEVQPPPAQLDVASYFPTS